MLREPLRVKRAASNMKISQCHFRIKLSQLYNPHKPDAYGSRLWPQSTEKSLSAVGSLLVLKGE